MKQRILIVEDDEIFLRPLQRTLEVAGYDVLVVPSGEEAIDLLKSDDVDLMLTDKRLPGIDGVEIVRRVKADHPNLAVVVMTAYGTIGSAVEAMRLGAEDYLVKPFDAAEVLMVLRRAIEFQELKTANRATIRATRSDSRSRTSWRGARSCRRSSTWSARSRASTRPCSSTARPASARSCSRGPSISTGPAGTVPSWR
jgi:DNA-binding NtrC family response regulator